MDNFPPISQTYEGVLRHQVENLLALADDYFSIKRKSAHHFRTESRSGNRLPNNKGTRRANVDGIELLELFCENRRSEGLVTADVHASQKDHECQKCPRVDRVKVLRTLRITRWNLIANI